MTAKRSDPQDTAGNDRAALKVVSLNVAHGRKRHLHQALLPREKIESNLDAVAEVIRREQPDIVALQEADGPSIWSGWFHHVEYLANRAEMPHFIHGEHVKRMRLSYGTALLSKHAIRESLSFTFQPTRATLSKGMILGTVRWPGQQACDVDVASIHLEAVRKSVRRRQSDELATLLAGRHHPLILMGDFNCAFRGRETTLRRLVENVGLTAFQPDARHLITFPLLRRRFDWILISPTLEFVEYHTLPDVVSDHRIVVAQLSCEGGRLKAEG